MEGQSFVEEKKFGKLTLQANITKQFKDSTYSVISVLWSNYPKDTSHQVPLSFLGGYFLFVSISFQFCSKDLLHATSCGGAMLSLEPLFEEAQNLSPTYHLEREIELEIPKKKSSDKPYTLTVQVSLLLYKGLVSVRSEVFRCLTSQSLQSNELELIKSIFYLDDNYSVLPAILSFAVTTGNIMEILEFCVRKEVENTPHAPQLFRGESVYSKFIMLYIKRIGQFWINRILSNMLPLVLETAEKMGQIPEQISKDILENNSNLSSLTELALGSIINNQVPSKNLNYLCHLVYNIVNEKFPDSGAKAVGGLLFLRWICPTFLTPPPQVLDPCTNHGISFQLTHLAQSTPQLKRAMTLITKILQAVANQIPFGQKEAFMLPLNPIVEQYIPIVDEFILNLGTEPGCHQDEKIDPRDHYQTLNELFSFLGSNMKLLSPHLKSDFKSFEESLTVWCGIAEAQEQLLKIEERDEVKHKDPSKRVLQRRKSDKKVKTVKDMEERPDKEPKKEKTSDDGKGKDHNNRKAKKSPEEKKEKLHKEKGNKEKSSDDGKGKKIKKKEEQSDSEKCDSENVSTIEDSTNNDLKRSSKGTPIKKPKIRKKKEKEVEGEKKEKEEKEVAVDEKVKPHDSDVSGKPARRRELHRTFSWKPKGIKERENEKKEREARAKRKPAVEEVVATPGGPKSEGVPRKRLLTSSASMKKMAPSTDPQSRKRTRSLRTLQPEGESKSSSDNHHHRSHHHHIKKSGSLTDRPRETKRDDAEEIELEDNDELIYNDSPKSTPKKAKTPKESGGEGTSSIDSEGGVELKKEKLKNGVKPEADENLINKLRKTPKRNSEKNLRKKFSVGVSPPPVRATSKKVKTPESPQGGESPTSPSTTNNEKKSVKRGTSRSKMNNKAVDTK